MKLIMSDKQINIPIRNTAIVKYVDLSSLKIANCCGCFGCWVKTPGKCVIRDDAPKVYSYIAQSSEVLYVSRLCYGGYDSTMKTMLERAIPIQQAFIRILDGETHHVQRNVVEKNATIIAYGDISDEEKDIFRSLVERNAKNMSFKSYVIRFVSEVALENTIKSVVEKWERY